MAANVIANQQKGIKNGKYLEAVSNYLSLENLYAKLHISSLMGFHADPRSCRRVLFIFPRRDKDRTTRYYHSAYQRAANETRIQLSRAFVRWLPPRRQLSRQSIRCTGGERTALFKGKREHHFPIEFSGELSEGFHLASIRRSAAAHVNFCCE